MSTFLVVKVKEGKGHHIEADYKNRVYLYDAKLLLLILKDLENIYNAPIRKACKMFIEDKTKVFPI